MVVSATERLDVAARRLMEMDTELRQAVPPSPRLGDGEMTEFDRRSCPAGGSRPPETVFICGIY